MLSKTLTILCIFSLIALSDAFEHNQNIESRGKKKKKFAIELFVYFADIVIKKIFILKLVYAFVLWCVIHKAGYFLGWFVSFLVEKKDRHHEHHEHVPHYDHYGHYGPYRRQNWGNKAF
ncbi:uncharacterized protein LOC113228738 [Hyposmocoma kahamanoa]|uniref:uncharacterized protein LOC113228738 n=1 Tax=Hyposmocoma kahamanoa TaxID=1477025 RepID=UPI000E6D78AD|nr:uncharacterized protein LOC113228738 [Hyposmocoma kahamanoa]